MAAIRSAIWSGIVILGLLLIMLEW